jgi:hypothetical protein
LFTGIVLVVLRSSVEGGPSEWQRGLTARFVEVGWMLALAVSLGFARYGDTNVRFVS